MNVNHPFVWSITVACALFLSGCGDAASRSASPRRTDDNTLVLVVTTESPPYAYVDEAGKIRGIDVEIATAAAAKLNRKLEVRATVFEELFPMVKSGQADMAGSGLTITKGRLRSVDFTIPYAEEGGAFLYRTGEPTPTMTLAESIRVATIDSTTHDLYLTRHGIDPLRYRSLDEAVRDLERKKADAVFYDMSSLSVMAATSNGKLATSPLVTREFFGIAVRKDFPELKTVLNEMIKERRAK